MNLLYPWQHVLWRQHMPRAAQRHHALLLRGPRGVGKRRFAETIARSLLCGQPGNEALPCGACQACTWFAQAQHPDFVLIEPQLDSDEGESSGKKSLPLIKIDQVRAAVGALALSTHQGGRRVVLLAPAESMNAHAANALLKTLEEPPPGTLFLLINHQRGALPATIVSRCRAIDLPVPPTDVTVQWLRAQAVDDAEALLTLSGGAPLLALELAAPEARARRGSVLAALAQGGSLDPVEQAERLKQLTAAELIETMQTWSHDLLAHKLGCGGVYHPAARDAQADAAAHARIEDLLALQRKLLDAKRLAHHPLNARLVAEDLLLTYRDACGR